MTRGREQSTAAGFPGDVLVAACGFIVTGAAWGLFGYLDGGMVVASSAAVFYALALMHAVAGVTIFARRSFAVPVGIVVATAGLAVAAYTPQLVLVFTNGVILLLLLLARANVSAHHKVA